MNAKKNSEQKVVQDTRHQEKKRKIAKPEENAQTWGGFFLLFVFCFVFFLLIYCGSLLIFPHTNQTHVCLHDLIGIISTYWFPLCGHKII